MAASDDALRAYWAGVTTLTLPAAMANVAGRLETVEMDGRLLPVLVHALERGVSNVGSLRTHYLDYAREELARLPTLGGAARWATSLGLSVLEKLAQGARLDDVVTVNNLLLTTCLYNASAFSTGAATRATEALRAKHAGRAIVWRSLARELTPALVAELVAAGGVLLPWRSIYLSSPEVLRSALRESRDAARDVALARRPKEGYRWSEGAEFSHADWARAEALYRQLYLGKYSRFNPAYTAAFFRMAHGSGLFRFFGLRALEGELDGIVGLQRAGGVQAAPFLGYDLTKPKPFALYRTLCAKHWVHAMDDGLLAHQSAGAATFKKNRRAQPAVEYVAVFHAHLPWRRRLAWTAFIRAIRHIAVPLTQRYEQ